MTARISIVACILLWAGLVSGGAAFARPAVVPGPIPATVVKVIDGDTLAVEAYIWPDQWLAVHVRIRGIDTPETHGACALERQQAEAAKKFVAAALNENKATLTDITFDKYGGRVVANVITPGGENLGRILLAKGLARTYSGGHKSGWCGPSARA
jgi:endonuclease YncB( thermonuclease family)